MLPVFSRATKRLTRLRIHEPLQSHRYRSYTLDTSRKRCLVFPGQGAQFVGMGKDLYDAFPYIKQLMQECDHIVGYALSDTMFHGNLQDLTETTKAQPAVLIHSLSMLKVLQTEYGLFHADSSDFQAAMGLSLGEYSALTSLQCFQSEQDAIFIVDKRARAMQQCCVNEQPGNEDLEQKMLAIIHDGSLTHDKLRAMIDGLALDGQYVADIANYNSPRQTVISGHKFALDAVHSALKRQMMKAKYINAGGAFHSSLMKQAKQDLQSVLKQIDVELPFGEKALICNVNASIIDRNVCCNGDVIKELLYKQVCTAIDWYPSIMKCIRELGVTEFVEIGPKTSISGMIREICKLHEIKDIQLLNFDKLDDLKQLQ